MKILVINPVGTSRYDKDDLQYLTRKARKETELEITSLSKGPEEITTFESQVEICPEVLKILKEKEYDAAIINCFANPCIDAAKEVSEKPVVGPGEASLYLSLMLGDRISIISPVDKTIPQFSANVRKMGIENRISSIRSVRIPVEALADDLRLTKSAIVRTARECIENDGADVVVLGCTGMAYVADEVREEIPVPVIEPLSAALGLAELWVQMKVAQSKYIIYKR
ncbi:MAG: aspartate/glutamate racemase family protein [Candidatus Acidifodinimicrobium sp.]